MEDTAALKDDELLAYYKEVCRNINRFLATHPKAEGKTYDHLMAESEAVENELRKRGLMEANPAFPKEKTKAQKQWGLVLDILMYLVLIGFFGALTAGAILLFGNFGKLIAVPILFCLYKIGYKVYQIFTIE